MPVLLERDDDDVITHHHLSHHSKYCHFKARNSQNRTAMTDLVQNANGYRHHTEQVQVIGEEQRFTDVLPKSIESWGLLEKGFNYDVVAVFGSQSTGKSKSNITNILSFSTSFLPHTFIRLIFFERKHFLGTLLNRVFGTTFDVMNEAERRQTTKGIWMCKGKDMDVLVMDVEGADGRERGEDQVSKESTFTPSSPWPLVYLQDFERKAALFSMASSEVIIVNMWEHQLSFKQTKLSKRLHHNSVTSPPPPPLSNLENTITTDLNRIWDTLVKVDPEGTESSKITDYFDLTFTALSHKILQPENFDREVENFRKRFVDKTHPDYVFKPIYHKRIPADGLAQYMSGIWVSPQIFPSFSLVQDAVVSNKDLDLPTQQELLAQFRCDEIAATSFQQFTTLIQPLKVKMEFGKLVDELGTKMLEARTTCLASFDLAASRYHSGVYQRKRTEFMAKMNSNLSSLFLAQLKILSKSIIKKFQAELIHELKTGSGARDFKEVVSSQMQSAQKEFEDGVKSVLLDETDWTYTEELTQLLEDLTNISNQCKVDEMKKLLASIEKEMKRETNEVVELAMSEHKIEMWDAVLSGFQEALNRAKTKYHDKSASFSCTEEDDQKTKEIISRKGWISLRSKIDEQTVDSALLVKLKLAFEERFRYDAAGVPRVWKPEDDIDGAFRTAREAVSNLFLFFFCLTLALIPIYAAIQPTQKALEICIPSNSTLEFDDPDLAEYDFESSRLILTGIKQTELSNRLKKESDAYYLEAKRSLVSSISQIPYWMYAVIAILGWNEFLAVLKSPVYFATLVILAMGVWMTFKLNMVRQGPILAIGTGLYLETSKVAQEKLKEYLSVTDLVVKLAVEKKEGSPRRTNSTTDVDDAYHLKKRLSRTRLSAGSPPTRDDGPAEEIPLQELK
ncbi:uncharacterized protein VP01_1437g2 [Puccinia sorghi]|uniref:GB1/RHD3-type G domain-containing protein n=1 Tax=Puccinia sorghi TaxID=27349 RepID=A0A0L6VKA6_9BASI|nr:uncharacterized protein VP01_1437g2 [Puccinia sorghi]